MSTYYTPELEEFHYNFPYEQKAVTGGWREMEFSFNLKKIKSYLEQGRIRVKHLDREDIESCGWEVSEHHNGDYSRENFTTYEDDAYYMTIFNTPEKRAWFCVYGKDEEIGLVAEFRVKIKNKSELKRILKQIQI